MARNAGPKTTLDCYSRDALADVINTARADGLDNAVLQRLSDALTTRAADCRKILMAAPAPETE